jgi:hypothetical protein
MFDVTVMICFNGILLDCNQTLSKFSGKLLIQVTITSIHLDTHSRP